MIDLKNFYASQLRDCLTSLGDIFRSKISSGMIILVIGLALALPCSFLMVITNIKHLSNTLQESPQVSIFLKKPLAPEEEQFLIKKIQALSVAKHISKIESISKEAALNEFKEPLNLAEIVHLLGENPLPASLILTLKSSLLDEKELKELTRYLQQLPEVESVQIDFDWIKRLSTLLIFAKRLASGVAVLLALAVLLIIGNTLKLKIENRRDSIEIASLLGASKSFIQRPFLYLGFWYGFLGSIMAIFILAAFTLWLKDSQLALMVLYNNNGKLEGLDVAPISLLLLLGSTLGFGGAWLCVGRQIRELHIK